MAEKLRSLGLEVIVGSEGDGWEVEVCVTEALYEQGYRGCVALGAAPHALCIAALRATAERGRGEEA